MKKEGLQPTRVNFNELINAMIDKDSAQGRADVQGIVAGGARGRRQAEPSDTLDTPEAGWRGSAPPFSCHGFRPRRLDGNSEE